MRPAGFLLISILIAVLMLGCFGQEAKDGIADQNSNSSSSDREDQDSEGDDSSDGLCSRDCEPVSPVPWPEPDLSGPSVVSFDEDLFFTINGQKFFPLGFYSVPNDEEGLAQFKSEGFNIALTGGGCCSGDSLQRQIEVLERGRDAGVMIILKPWTPRDQVLERPEIELAAELEARNGVGGLFGWYTFDEPGLHVPPKELTGRMHEVLVTYDPNHLDALVDAPLNDFSLYVDDCSFFMVDPYPSDWAPLVYVKATMEEAWEATQGLKPIVGVMQAFSWDWYHGMTDHEYHPNGWEMRNMTWQFIVHGASGLIPWNYAGDYTIRFQEEIWASYLETAAEINELMRVILSPNVDQDLDPQSSFLTLFDYVVKEGDLATWIFSVSENDRLLRVSLDLSGIGSDLCIVDYTTAEVFAQDDQGRIELVYEPLQVRILQLMP